MRISSSYPLLCNKLLQILVMKNSNFNLTIWEVKNLSTEDLWMILLLHVLLTLW